MTRDEVKAVLDRVLTWSPAQQEVVAELLLAIEQRDEDRYQLTDEQAEEVKRRLADPDPRYLSLAEVRAHFRAKGE
jgi:hypothetical protein